MAKNKKKRGGSNSTAAAMNNKLKLQNAMANNMLGVNYSKGRTEGWGLAILFMCWVLRKHYGFGQKRMLRLVHDLNEFALDVIGYGPDGVFKSKDGEFNGVSIQDVIDALDEECKIMVDLDTGLFRAKPKKKDMEFVRVDKTNEHS